MSIINKRSNATSSANNKTFILLRNLAFLFILCNLVCHLFPFRPIVWRLGLVFISIIGLVIHVNQYKFTQYGKVVLWFVALNSLYFFVSLTYQASDLTNYGNILCSTLPFFLFYVLTIRGVMTQKTINYFFILSVICGLIYYRHGQLYQAEWMGRDVGEFTVNRGGIFLMIFPLLFFEKRQWVALITVAITIFIILFSVKRGNILALAIPLILWIRYYFRNNKMNNKGSFLKIIIFIAGMAAIAVYAYKFSINNDYFMYRLERTKQGYTSGRDEIYANVFYYWYNSDNVLNIIFGHGTDATVNQFAIRAHSDWLEILCDFGLVGVLLYFSLFISLIFEVISIKKINLQLFYVLLSVFSIWFLKSIYSMAVTDETLSYLSLTIGIVLGYKYRLLKGLPND